TGELSFIGAPDREAPSDSDTDHVYEVQVTVSDGVQSDTQALSITVDDVNEAPAWSASLPTQVALSGQPMGVSAADGILSVATDPESDALQILLVSAPTHGSVQIAADGSFVYTATGGHVGPDEFTVALSDGGLTGPAQVIRVQVSAPPSVPAAPEPTLPALPPSPEPAPAPEPAPPPEAPTPVAEATPEPTAPRVAAAPAVPVALPALLDGALILPSEPSAAGRSADGMPGGAPASTSSGGPLASLRWDMQGVNLAGDTASPLQVLARVLDRGDAGGSPEAASPDAAPRLIELGEVSAWPPEAGELGDALDVQAMQAGGAALSAGAVWWAARTSGLLASMAISAPVWRGIDPLPVLGQAPGEAGPRRVASPHDRDEFGPDAQADAQADALFDRPGGVTVGRDIG
ncbi:MAG: cadherin-like domain-containing protein, partial [Burkholderiales bacterium]|nr:cadherin-like domain-containing protein [Burkholderiales bacterium]